MKDATEIVCVLDKSGSMQAMKDDAIGGFNSFLDEQRKEPGEANLTVVMFDTHYSVWDTKAIADHEELSEANYVPGGGTALLDAVGKAINELNARLMQIDENDRPDKAIFVIVTDGMENSSREFDQATVKKMIEEQTADKGWQFLFLGANIDAFAEGGKLGVRASMVADYTDVGVKSAHMAFSHAVSSYRSGGTKGLVGSNWQDKLTADDSDDSK